jgi:hypothetical protein
VKSRGRQQMHKTCLLRLEYGFFARTTVIQLVEQHHEVLKRSGRLLLE